MGEAWRPVPEYEGRYEVSDAGVVRSLDRTLRDGRRWKGRVLQQVPDNHGYLQVNLCRDNQQRTRRVAGLVAEAFHGRAAPGQEVCHTNGDRLDNRAANLRWDSRSGNVRDAVRHGTHPETRKATCPRGHALTAPNLAADKLRKGHRECLACRKAGQASRYKNRPFDVELADAYYREMCE